MLLAPPDWTPDAPNPFTVDGAYGPAWSCFRLTEAEDDWVRNGRQASGLYVAAFGRQVPRLSERLADFLRYEAGHGRTVIVAGLDEDFVAAALALAARPAVRPGDPRWLVHSTSLAAWAAIERGGELQSSALRARGGVLAPPLGELLVGDPPDYAEYVALGPLEAIGPEFVQACRQAGRMLPAPDTEYLPGVRLYFDAHQITAAGLGVRDGLHTLKVRDRLPLTPYLVAALTARDVPPPAGGKPWTTTLFRDAANAVFFRRGVN